MKKAEFQWFLNLHLESILKSFKHFVLTFLKMKNSLSLECFKIEAVKV